MATAVGAAIAGSRAAFAQSSNKVLRLGTLTAGPPLDEKSPNGATLLKVLERNGYVAGKNLSLTARGASGQVNKLGEMIREMKDQVDVFVVTGYPTTLACKVANVPTVVAVGAGDSVATHLIDSLAHPGGNLTGISDKCALRQAALRQALEPQVATVSEIPAFDLGLAYELYSSLLKPIETTWQPAKSLIEVTNGALGELPLSLLPTAPAQVDIAAKPLF